MPPTIVFPKASTRDTNPPVSLILSAGNNQPILVTAHYPDSPVSFHNYRLRFHDITRLPIICINGRSCERDDRPSLELLLGIDGPKTINPRNLSDLNEIIDTLLAFRDATLAHLSA